jgi:hypothetical protein
MLGCCGDDEISVAIESIDMPIQAFNCQVVTLSAAGCEDDLIAITINRSRYLFSSSL